MGYGQEVEGFLASSSSNKVFWTSSSSRGFGTTSSGPSFVV
jgi:hypothetical protein